MSRLYENRDGKLYAIRCDEKDCIASIRPVFWIEDSGWIKKGTVCSHGGGTFMDLCPIHSL